MKKALVIVFTICLLVSLVFFLKSTDLEVVTKLIRQTGSKFLLLLLSTFIAYLFATISWQYTLGEHAKYIATGRLFLIRHVGETVAMLNPASVIGGDALKAVMLSKYGIPQKNIVWSMLFSRGVMVVSQLLLFATTVLTLAVHEPAIGAQVLDKGMKSGWPPFLLANWRRLKIKGVELLQELPLMLKANKRMLFISCFFALLHWLFGGLEFYLILKFLGLKVSVIQALVVDLGVVLFKAAAAFIPGQLGVEEYGNKIMLLAIGIQGEEIWVTASILRRARQLFWIAFAIGIYLLMFKKQAATDER
ncbi:MAG: lysylphosphatidylglycerol synthase domain-containing protein [Bacteroidota bacterium]